MSLHGDPGASRPSLRPGRSGPGECSGGSRGADREVAHTLRSTSGEQQPAQNRIGPGESDCLIKT